MRRLLERRQPGGTVREYRCTGCGVINRAANNLTGMAHTTTGGKPSGCNGTYQLVEQADRIGDHPFTPAAFTDAWPDLCGYMVDGWPCGYSRAEHVDQGEVTPTETP
jgi:hypothetical protein